MKKIHILLRDRDVRSALDKLRGLGVLHVEHEAEPEDASLDELYRDRQTLNRALDLLGTFEPAGAGEAPRDWRGLAERLFSLTDRIQWVRDGIAKRAALIAQWEPWGDFDPQAISHLQSCGVVVRLVEVSGDDIAAMPEGAVVHRIAKKGKRVRAAVISRPDVKLPVPALGLPSMGLAALRGKQEEDRKKIEEAEGEIRAAGRFRASLDRTRRGVEEQIVFEEAFAGRRRDEDLALIKGFCPEESCPKLNETAKTESWGILVEDPAPDDRVPTLVHRPKWVELIRPMYQMINVLPGYREFDISPLFLVFLTIFVGMLIGDAGYGLVYLLFAFVLHRRRPGADPKVFYLLYLFSASTILYGVLTGTYFGQAWVRPALQPVVPWLNDNYNVQLLCFVIAAVHLSLAHFWRTADRWPSAAFLGQLGWAVMIWAMFFVARTLVLGDAWPAAGWVFLYGGLGLILLFSHPNRNPLKAVGAGLGELALNAVNSFTDVVSYIRLFAVGLATVAVADAANGMLAQMVRDPSALNIFLGLIGFILHPMNLLLAAMAILVHGLRLNVLEFSNHMSMEWAGFPYRPLKKAESH